MVASVFTASVYTVGGAKSKPDPGVEPISVEDVGAAPAISRRSLEQRFRKALGHSPGQEIVRVHIARAKNLLAETDLPMEKVATLSGFTGARHMSRWFRHAGEPMPTAYRKRHRPG